MTLFMRDQENIEKGLEKGIMGMAAALKELNIPNDTMTSDRRKYIKMTVGIFVNRICKIAADGVSP